MTFSVNPYEQAVQRKRAWLDARVAEAPLRFAQAGSYALGSIAPEIVQMAIARPLETGATIAPLAPIAERAVQALAARAALGSVSWAELDTCDVLCALVTTGTPLPTSALDAVREVLPAIATARSDERVNNHWHRGLIALALDVPTVYRGIAGFEMHDPIPFTPGATFGPNLQGFLGHLAGAVESGAPIDACMPAWADLAAYSLPLLMAHAFRDSFFLWGAWILQHRIAKAPLAGVAQWVHDSLYALAGAPA